MERYNPNRRLARKGMATLNIKLVAAGDTLLAMEKGMVRSTDGGDTWMTTQVPWHITFNESN